MNSDGPGGGGGAGIAANFLMWNLVENVELQGVFDGMAGNFAAMPTWKLGWSLPG